MLRKHGVVGSFVEFCGDGLSALSLADRATLSNMCPEYGATTALFPVDDETLRYLRADRHADDAVELVERYTKEQGLFRRDGDQMPSFDEMLELDLARVVPSLAGPSRPQDRVALPDVPASFHKAVRHARRRRAGRARRRRRTRAARRLGRDRRDHRRAPTRRTRR